MATNSSTLAWRIPWREEPGRLQSMGSQSQTRLSHFTSLHFTLQIPFHPHPLRKSSPLLLPETEGLLKSGEDR